MHPIGRPEVEQGTRKSHRHRCGSDPRSPDRPFAPRIAHPAIETPRFRKIVSRGLQLASRGGKSAKRRARVAVARKLAVLMHRLWVTGEEYEPVGYKPKRAAA